VPDRALDDIRVVDLSQGIAGPYCTRLLADLGAEVIKVEPPEGDYTRRLGPFPDDIPDPDKSGLFIHLNGNKKSVTLDISTTSGQVLLRKLLENADVLVESADTGHMATLGLGYDDLKSDFPSLVYCSITPFGQTGPYAHFKGNSLTALAMSGLMYCTGDPDKEPLATGAEAAEYIGALHAWIAVMAAIEHRAQTNAGQHIDVSLLEALGCADEYNTAMYSYLGAVRRRFYSRHHIPTYPSEIFRCRDGHVVVIGGATGFPTMMAILIERPELESDPLFTNLWLRTMQWQKFNEILQPYLDEHDWEDLVTRGQELRVPFAAVLNAKTLLENAHLASRRFFQTIDQPGIGKLPLAGGPFNMEGTPLRYGPAPALGADNPGVLAEAGYDPDDQRILRERGVA
jgi:crotonobetainyl-CoA:carnitine CoA-transferase CaiB-like acyl-CoA transferase